MKKEKILKLEQIAKHCLYDLYLNSTPSVNFYDLLKGCTTFETREGDEITTSKPLSEDEVEEYGYIRKIDFSKYFIKDTEFDKIVNKYLAQTNDEEEKTVLLFNILQRAPKVSDLSANELDY